MKPPTLHEEMDLLDQIERELVRLTTAELETSGSALQTPPSANIFKTVIPAKAGTHAECDVPTESEAAVTRLGYGSRRSPG